MLLLFLKVLNFVQICSFRHCRLLMFAPPSQYSQTHNVYIVFPKVHHSIHKLIMCILSFPRYVYD